MLDKPKKIPGADHPITISPAAGRVRVTVAGRVIAETTDALSLQEASYPPVLYVPRKDVDMAALERTDHSTHCPYKGDAAYYSIPAGGGRARNAIWSYEDPHEAVLAIKDHVAFYPDRVDSIDVTPA